jgi:hypothetical protein
MFGGPIAVRMLVLLGGLALLAWSPILAVVLLVLYLLIGPLRIIGEAVIIGLAGGISARITGVFNSPQRAERDRERYEDRRDRRRIRGRGAPRSRGRRGDRDYFPWQERGDDLPEDM